MVESREVPVCPCCHEALVYRDQRRRLARWFNGEKRKYLLTRMQCPACRKLHLVLPDFMSPHKHYATEVIENVVDGVSTPDDASTDLYPCERTMQRWSAWISRSKPQIDGCLKSIGARLLGFGAELMQSGDSLLDKLRKRGNGWLSTVNRFIYNSGDRIQAATPAADPHLICRGDPEDHEVSSSPKEVLHHGNQDSDQLANRRSAETVSADFSASG